jgi:hypothetical protein
MNATTRLRSIVTSVLMCCAVAGCGETERAASPDAGQLAALQARLDRVTAEVGLAKDASAIKKLQRAYGYYLDRGLVDDMADLFTTDKPTAAYGNGGVFVGQDSIRRAFHALSPNNRLDEGRMTTHMQLQGVVDVAPDGATAKARWRAFAMTANKGEAFWQEGPYECEYVKEQGVWKIQSLRWYQTFTAPYEGGWARKQPKAVTSATGTSGPTPDLPSEIPRKFWPEMSLTPFHYENATASTTVSTPAATPSSPPASLTDLQARSAALTHEIGLLRDEKSIEKLQRSWGYYLDKKLWDHVADLFADDGTFELGLSGVYVGKPSIRHSLDQFGPSGLQRGELFNHMLLQPIVHVADDGASAKARWRGFNQAGVYGSRAIWGEGVYENEYVKQNGIWKISKLHFFNSFTSPYEKGWAKEVAPAQRPVKKGFEPDRPPSLMYEAFPKFFVPPFHYPNPVTGKPPQIGAAATGAAQ